MLGNYDLIKVTTSDELNLLGLYKSGDKQKEAVILVHGFTSDFYSHDFYHTISRSLANQGNATILAQTRGTGLHTEFIKKDRSAIYLGSFYEKIEDAHLDISAFVTYLKDQGYTKIVLAGHSLGTLKITRYLFEGEHKEQISKLILLAPFDKGVFMEIKAGKKWDEYIKVAEQKIQAGLGKNIVPVPVYEDYPVSYETFLSWYKKSDLNSIWDFYKRNYDSKIISQIKIPVKVILGENDEFTNYPDYDESSQSVLEILKKHIPNCKTHLVPKSPHTFDNHEDEVAKEVAEFLN